MQNSEFSHLKAAIYCRKSQESEERQVLSLPAQKDEADKLIIGFGIRSSTVYEEAKSAKVSGKRVQFARMLKDIKLSRVHVIVCWKLDRLARNMVEGGQIIDLLQHGTIRAIITPGKTYYPNENALLMAVEFGSANQYSRDLSQNVMRGLVKKASNGYPPGRACIGFTNAQNPITRERIWEVDERRFPIVKKMFEMYLSGNYSGGKVHQWSVEVAKLTTPPHRKTGNKPIQLSLMYRMLQDPIYAGYFSVQGERYKLHETLPRAITIEEHYQILQMLGKKAVSRYQKHPVIFSGYIHSPAAEWVGADVSFQLRCDCGYKFAYRNRNACPRCGLRYENMNKPKYLKYTYYRNSAMVKRNESVKYISEQEIINAFLGYIESHILLSDQLIEWCRKYINEIQNDRVVAARAVQESNTKRESELHARRSRYRELLADGLISKEEYVSDIDKIDRELSILHTSDSNVDLVEKITNALTIGKRIVETFMNCDLEGKRTLLSKLGSYLVWNEKTLKIINVPVIQCLIDGLEKAKTYNPQFVPKNTIATQDETGTFQSVFPILCTMLGDVRTLLEVKNEQSTESES